MCDIDLAFLYLGGLTVIVSKHDPSENNKDAFSTTDNEVALRLMTISIVSNPSKQ
jgi:hypothetical protein